MTDRFDETNGQATYGSIAVDAIRSEFDQLLADVNPEPTGFFPRRRVVAGRLGRDDDFVRKAFYVTIDEAWAIENARQRLGGLELGQLHRMALHSYLPESSEPAS